MTGEPTTEQRIAEALEQMRDDLKHMDARIAALEDAAFQHAHIHRNLVKAWRDFAEDAEKADAPLLTSKVLTCILAGHEPVPF